MNLNSVLNDDAMDPSSCRIKESAEGPSTKIPSFYGRYGSIVGPERKARLESLLYWEGTVYEH